MTDELEFLKSYAHSLPEPENIFAGYRLPPGFALPDNILVFFHDFIVAAPNTHGRHTLVFPMDRMTYYLDQIQVDMEPGQVLYIPPFTMRFLHPGSQGFRRLFITFETDTDQIYLPKQGICRMSRRECIDVLHAFLDAYRDEKTPKASSLLTDFLFHIQKENIGMDPALKIPGTIEQALRIIDNEITAVDSIKTLAGRLGLSESHLRAVFRQKVHFPLGAYITNKRLDCAKYYLLKSRKPLAEIAALCGFSNIFVFSAFFKRNTGMPPTVFRRHAADADL